MVRLTAKAFIKIYKTCTSNAEVAQKTGLSHNAVKVRVHYYRSQGVDLPSFSLRHVTSREDWKALQKFAQEEGRDGPLRP